MIPAVAGRTGGGLWILPRLLESVENRSAPSGDGRNARFSTLSTGVWITVVVPQRGPRPGEGAPTPCECAPVAVIHRLHSQKRSDSHTGNETRQTRTGAERARTGTDQNKDQKGKEKAPVRCHAL